MVPQSSGKARLTMLAVAAIAGCDATSTHPLIDLPEPAVITATVPRGELVPLEVTNSTDSGVILSAPACTTGLELFSHGQWSETPATNPDTDPPSGAIPGGGHRQQP